MSCTMTFKISLIRILLEGCLKLYNCALLKSGSSNSRKKAATILSTIPGAMSEPVGF